MSDIQAGSSRFVAVQIIAKWLSDGDFPDRLLADAKVDSRPFVMEIVYGVVRWRRLLDGIVRILSSRQPDSKLRPYLLVGVYQIFKMESLPSHAVVYETVEAAKAGGLDYAAGFLNAVLRRAIREKDEIIKRIAKADLGTRESHPDVLVKRWIKNFGVADTKRLCKNNNRRPRIVIHPVSSRISMAEFRKLLEEKEIKFTVHPFLPDKFLVLSHGIKVPDIPGYRDGLFSVQDPATSEAVRIMDPQPGETVLDACAAPGGKTALIAERMQDTGTLIAMDLYEDRLQTVRQNMHRLQFSSVKVVQGDAGNDKIRQVAGIKEFDRILIDVPCTNTGVIQRRPDARWRFSEHRLDTLIKTQWAILCSISKLVKPGGVLVYSTCSLEPEEDYLLVEYWLKKEKQYCKEEEIRLFPPDSLTDGGYAVVLRRKS